jgi:hypothetical protein
MTMIDPDKARSRFAQALYNLMIKPGIYTLEEWHGLLDPASLFSTVFWGPWGQEPLQAGSIESWFDDEGFPSDSQLRMILDICKQGNVSTFMAALAGDVSSEYLHKYAGRYRSGREAQAEALQEFYKALNEHVDEVSPGLRAKLPWMSIWPHRIGNLMMGERARTILTTFDIEVPVELRDDVFLKVCEVIRDAKNHDWYRQPRKTGE